MIFLDITPSDFIKKFPSLGSIIIAKCKNENLPLSGIKPYITKDFVGAILNPEGPNKIKCFTDRSNVKSELSNLLLGILQK